jgi:hypothetical protein
VKKKQQNEERGKKTIGIRRTGSDNREFFRVDAFIHLFSSLVPKEERANIGSRTLPETPDSLWSADTLKRVDISGSGIAYDSDDFYALGDIVELRIMFEKDWGVPLLVYGEVLRVEPYSHHCRVSLKYLAMDERTRCIITRFVFERERQIIAEKRVGWL